MFFATIKNKSKFGGESQKVFLQINISLLRCPLLVELLGTNPILNLFLNFNSMLLNIFPLTNKKKEGLIWSGILKFILILLY